MNDIARPLVILAEDEGLLRLVIAQNLEDCGFAVLEAEDGLVALDYARSAHDCRLVLSDVRMPNMDGYTLAQNLLSLERHPPILLLTGYSDPLPEALKSHVTLLQKPITLEVLCEHVKRLCGPPASTRH